MEFIKVSKVEQVQLERLDKTLVGTLHLTPHHIIFNHPSEELWVTYSLINSVECHPQNEESLYPLEIKCHHFVFLTLTFKTQKEVLEVYQTINHLTCIDDISKFYAFHYKPAKKFDFTEGWSMYNPEAEYGRMGVGSESSQWRFTTLNNDYSFCETYPSVLAVPSKISDNVLNYAKKFRSRARIPALSYLHKNQASITRSSQPLVGLKQNRSIQDEKLIEAIFQTTNSETSPPSHLLIVDARPTANAMACTALGAGSEIIDFYKHCKKEYMGIENIHVVRDSLQRLVEVISMSDGKGVISKMQLSKSNWLKHIKTILVATQIIVDNVHNHGRHVLVHCSDGWDRTSQLTALSSLCLDPFYRTLKGFAILVEKEWVSFGHKFRSRSGHLAKTKNFVDNSSINLNHGSQSSLLTNMQNRFYSYSSPKPTADKETCPIFHQFLDCIFQLWTQYPTRFEFNEKMLLFLHEQVYACQFGTFLFDCQYDMLHHPSNIKKSTFSVWDYILSNPDLFTNSIYEPELDKTMNDGILMPDTKYLRYWSYLFCKRDEDLNPSEILSPLVSQLDLSSSSLAQPASMDNNSDHNSQSLKSSFSTRSSPNLSRTHSQVARRHSDESQKTTNITEDKQSSSSSSPKSDPSTFSAPDQLSPVNQNSQIQDTPAEAHSDTEIVKNQHPHHTKPIPSYDYSHLKHPLESPSSG